MINKSRPKILVDLEFKSREKLVLKNRSLDLYFNKYGNKLFHLFLASLYQWLVANKMRWFEMIIGQQKVEEH